MQTDVLIIGCGIGGAKARNGLACHVGDFHADLSSGAGRVIDLQAVAVKSQRFGQQLASRLGRVDGDESVLSECEPAYVVVGCPVVLYAVQ